MPHPTVFVQEIVVACAGYDFAGVRDELDLATEALGIGGCLDDVLFPARRRSATSGMTGTSPSRPSVSPARWSVAGWKC